MATTSPPQPVVDDQNEKLPEIPQIDLARDDNTVALELHAALTTVGFATLLNHGVDQSIRDKAFAASKSFFALPIADKLSCVYQGHSSNRGYIAVGKEQHDDSTSADFKETYDINPDGSSSGDSQPWPPISTAVSGPLSTFQHDMTEYFDQMDRMHLRMLRLIAIGLDLQPDFFIEQCNERHANLRLLHYPEIKIPPRSLESIGDYQGQEPIIRGAVHTDFGTITLLAQDSVGGLRVKCLDGTWVGVKPVMDSFVVNVGDMLQRWTNDILKANPHQVVDSSTPDSTIIPERFSIAFFCNANKETILSAIDQCVSEERPARYEPVKAHDYIIMRLSQTVEHA